MPPPVLEEQLLSLGSKTKIAVGSVLIVGGAILALILWGHGWIYWGTVFMVVFGSGMTWLGVEERRQEKAIETEIDRATSEWAELERRVTAARAAGGSASRVLQQEGYARPEVRRWILARLESDRDGGPLPR